MARGLRWPQSQNLSFPASPKQQVGTPRLVIGLALALVGILFAVCGVSSEAAPDD